MQHVQWPHYNFPNTFNWYLTTQMSTTTKQKKQKMAGCGGRGDCYNIEKNFKCNTVISTCSDHITIFQILSTDIWQLRCQQRQNK